MAEETTEKKTRRSRFFLYQDGKHVVIGSMKVRYEPSLDKNIFGSVEVTTLFPKKREWKNTFTLDLYPTVQDLRTGDPRKNILKDADEGIGLLWIEGNRAAGVQSRAVAGIKKEEFYYKNLTILTEDKVTPTDNGFTIDQYIFDGIINRKMKNLKYLRKGDKVKVRDCQEDTFINPVTNQEESRVNWQVKWDPSKIVFTPFEYIRRWWYKHFNHKLYLKRYHDSAFLELAPEDVWVVSGDPVEKGTERDE